jgi:multiple sugar transport system ATP-binding protein
VRVGVDAATASPGQPVQLGVRPEHLSLDGPGDAISATATFVESLGAATYAYATPPGSGETLTVQLPGEVRVAGGQALSLRVPSDRAHLFDVDGAAFRRLA